MPRPKCCCKVRGVPAHRLFRPHGTDEPPSDQVVLLLEELEAVRLADLEGLYQEEAARLMEVSRPTFGRLLTAARRKLARAVVLGLGLRIEGDFPQGGVEAPPACLRGPGTCCRARARETPCPGAARSHSDGAPHPCPYRKVTDAS